MKNEIKNTLQEQIVELTKKLISVRSTQDNPKELAEALAIVKDELYDFPIEEFESNGFKSLLIRNTNKNIKHFKLIFNAHIDVVPGKKEQFHPYEKEGKLFGRGACDMKGATVAMILLFRHFAKTLSYPIALQISSDEENKGTHSTKYQLEQGIRTDFVISGENSDFQIKTQAKGHHWITLTAHGKAAHGAHLWAGDNALWKLHDALGKLRNAFPIPDKAVWKTTISLAKIETPNIAFNNIPDECSAYLDVRFIPEEKDAILAKIKTIVGSDIEVTVIDAGIPQYIASDNLFIKQLQKSITAITNKTSKLITSHATSDIRLYNAIGNVGVEFGAKGKGVHTANEWVDIKSLEDYYHILKHFLLALETQK